MLIRSLSFLALTLVVLITTRPGGMQSAQKREGASVLNSLVDEEIVVRFFYNPPGDYFHKPLVFGVVREKDPRLNTAPILLEGRTAYVTGHEMQQLIEGLDRAGLSWQKSEKVEALGSFHHIMVGGVMEIRVVSPKGTAVATVSPKRICPTLEPLDAALATSRALWEFQLFRVEDGCKVPGFNNQAYPDHW